MDTLKVLGLAGSGRDGSYNRKLLAVALQGLTDRGVEILHWDVRESRIPLYEQRVEEEEGRFPDIVKELRGQVLSADGVLLVCPEYNALPTPLLKSVIDWCSRPDPETGQNNVWKGKVVALASASPGPFGGTRGLIALRQALAHVQAILVPETAIVGKATEAFTPEGKLAFDYNQKELDRMMDSFVRVATALRSVS